MMKVQIHTDNNIAGREELARRIEGVAEAAFRGFSDRITRVEVHLSDENGSQSGEDDEALAAEAQGGEDLANIVLERSYPAPPEQVFEAWTKPEQLREWFAPGDRDQWFTTLSFEADVRLGGRYRYALRSPGGVDYKARGKYHEVVPGARLVFDFAWEHADETLGPETTVTLTFERHAQGTQLTLRQGPLAARSERALHHEGWSEILDHLHVYLMSRSGPSQPPAPAGARA